MGDADRIRVRINDDGLEVHVAIDAGPRMDRTALLARLDALDVRAGLEEPIVARLTLALERDPATPGELCVARGEPATPGRPATLELVEAEAPLPGTLREDGSLDFRERRLIVPVEAGDPIALVLPAVEGKPGWSVFGTPIEPEPVSERPFRLGEGVRLEVDRVVAVRSGARTVDPEGGLDVVELSVHAGSVDLRSGHLETRGSLSIGRDVMAGMRVRAAHDVRIGGLVDGGVVEAEGSIEVVGGALGGDAGRICARGDLRVDHALGIRLRAMGVIRIARHVSTSHLHGREVEVEGRALSEEIAAEERIRVRFAGSPQGAPCRLRAAVPLEPEDFDPSEQPAPVGGPSATRRGGLRRGRGPRTAERSTRRDRSHLATKRDLETRLSWRRSQQRLERTASIVIEGEAHAGCLIEIGRARHVLERSARACTFHLDPGSGELVRTENPR